MVCSAVADTRRLAASGSARCYRQILHGKDDYPTMLMEIKRESVKRVLKAIVTRYGIDLTD